MGENKAPGNRRNTDGKHIRMCSRKHSGRQAGSNPAPSSIEGVDDLRTLFIYGAAPDAAPTLWESRKCARRKPGCGRWPQARPLPGHGGVAGGEKTERKAKSMARGKKKELLRQQARLEAEEEFRRQVDRECAYYGMTRGDLAAQIPMPPSTLSGYMREPGRFRVWQITRIAEILKLGGEVVAPMMGLELGASA